MAVETRLTDIDDGTTQVIEVTTGPRGPVVDFITGSTPPTPEVGNPGDMYLISTGSSDIGDLYKKSIGDWELKGNIRGPVLVNSVNSKTGAVVITAPDITTGKFGIGVIPTGNTATTVALGNHTHAGVYEPIISSGTTSQYLRGDKTWSNPGLVDVEKTATTPATEYSPGVYVQPIAMAGEWPGTFGTVLTAIHGLDRGFQLFFAKDALPPKIRSSDSGPAGAGIGWRSWMTLADNDTVVHRSGNETIAGTKTFSSAPVVPDNSFTIAKVNGLQSALGDHNHDSRYYTASLTDSRYINYGDTLMNTNPFGGKKLYINSINNAMFRMDARYSTSVTIHNATTDAQVGAATSGSLLFNGEYEGTLSIPVGHYAKVVINFNGGYYTGYPYGLIFISSYHTRHMASAKLRVHNHFASQGVGWKEVNFDVYSEGTSHKIMSARNEWYQISDMEIIVYAPATGDLTTGLTQIEWNLDRPGTNEMPVVDKYRTNVLYSNLLWGSLNNPVARINADGSAVFTGTVSSQGSTLVKTNDPRLSDARPPTAHNHDTRYYTKAEVDALIAAALNG